MVEFCPERRRFMENTVNGAKGALAVLLASALGVQESVAKQIKSQYSVLEQNHGTGKVKTEMKLEVDNHGNIEVRVFSSAIEKGGINIYDQLHTRAHKNFTAQVEKILKQGGFRVRDNNGYGIGLDKKGKEIYLIYRINIEPANKANQHTVFVQRGSIQPSCAGVDATIHEQIDGKRKSDKTSWRERMRKAYPGFVIKGGKKVTFNGHCIISFYGVAR